jgi:hypothetical protein
MVTLLIASCENYHEECANVQQMTIHPEFEKYLGPYKPDNWWKYIDQFGNTDSVFVSEYVIDTLVPPAPFYNCIQYDHRSFRLRFPNPQEDFLIYFQLTEWGQTRAAIKTQSNYTMYMCAEQGEPDIEDCSFTGYRTGSVYRHPTYVVGNDTFENVLEYSDTIFGKLYFAPDVGIVKMEHDKIRLLYSHFVN